MKHLSLFALVAAATLRAQQVPAPPRLVADFSTDPATAVSSSPAEFVAVGAMTCFVASTPTHGRELYRSFGSLNTTALVRDLAAGAASSLPRELTAVAGRLFFFANDGESGEEVHVSDGTAAGTRMIADLEPGASGSVLRGGFAVNGKFVFARGTQSVGLEPWVSDGTAEGTHLLFDVNPGAPSSINTLAPIAAVVARDGVGREQLVFVAAAASGLELWSTDGTSGGTQRLRSLGGVQARLNSWSTGRTRSGRAVLDLMLSSFLPSDSRQVAIASDGSPSGTVVLSDSPPEQVGTIGERLRSFGAYVAIPHDEAVLLVDGDPIGSRRIALPGGLRFAQVLHEVGNALFVQAQRGTQAVLFRLDSVASSFVEVGTLPYPPSFGVNGGGADTLVLGGRIVSTGVGSSAGLWAIDPTSGSAEQLAPTFGGELVAGSGTVFFAISDAVVGVEPGITDGSLGGTRRLIDLATPPTGQLTVSSRSSGFHAFGSRALFAIARGVSELSMFVSDGTALGSTEFARIDASSLIDAVEAGGRMWFAARASRGGSELWMTDGSAAGTIQIRSPASIEVRSNLLPIGDAVVFLGTSMNVFGLYLAAGHEFSLLASMPGAVGGRVARLGDRVVVAIRDGLRAELALAVFDPVARSLFNLASVPIRLWPKFDFVTGHDRVWFAGLDASGRDAIWSTDGTAANTVVEFSAPATSSALAQGSIRIGRDSVWLALAQRVLALDVETRIGRGFDLPASSLLGSPVILGDRLVYSVGAFSAGDELWSIDGSTGSAQRLRVVDSLSGLQSLGGRYALVSTRSSSGAAELLVTDGTLDGTRSLAPMALSVGGISQFASERFVIGGQAWLLAEDQAVGFEPHVIDVGAVAESSVAACGGDGRAASLSLDGALELGARREFRVRSSAGSVGFLLLGLDPGRSIPFAAAGLCQLAVDPSIAFVSAPLAMVAGQASMLLDVPDLALLDGVLLSAQAVIGGTDAALGFDLSNGLAMSVGR